MRNENWEKLAHTYHLTMAQLQAERMSYLQCEGYDEEGGEYETLDAWLERKPVRASFEPYDGGRGAGALGCPLI